MVSKSIRPNRAPSTFKINQRSTNIKPQRSRPKIQLDPQEASVDYGKPAQDTVIIQEITRPLSSARKDSQFQNANQSENNKRPE